MKALIKTLTLVFVISTLSSVAQAKGGRGGQFKEEIYQQLDLTPQQKTQLEQLKANRGDMKALREQKKDLRKQFQAALAKDASESELRGIHEQQAELKRKMENARFEKMMAVRKVLTPEQRTKFHALMKEKRGQHKGKWRGDKE